MQVSLNAGDGHTLSIQNVVLLTFLCLLHVCGSVRSAIRHYPWVMATFLPACCDDLISPSHRQICHCFILRLFVVSYNQRKPEQEMSLVAS